MNRFVMLKGHMNPGGEDEDFTINLEHVSAIRWERKTAIVWLTGCTYPITTTDMDVLRGSINTLEWEDSLEG
jgi:hypothetical protein